MYICMYVCVQCSAEAHCALEVCSVTDAMIMARPFTINIAIIYMHMSNTDQ